MAPKMDVGGDYVENCRGSFRDCTLLDNETDTVLDSETDDKLQDELEGQTVVAEILKERSQYFAASIITRAAAPGREFGIRPNNSDEVQAAIQAALEASDLETRVQQFKATAQLNSFDLLAFARSYGECWGGGFSDLDKGLEARSAELLSWGALKSLQDSMPIECALIQHWRVLLKGVATGTSGQSTNNSKGT